MNRNFDKIEVIISELRACKNKLISSLDDNQDSVVYLTNKIDSIISRLESGLNSMRNNKANMDSKKVW